MLPPAPSFEPERGTIRLRSVGAPYIRGTRDLRKSSALKKVNYCFD